jgi:putative transposase
VSTGSGTVDVAFVIDVSARRIVGWRALTSMKTQLMLDAPEHATWQRKTPDNKSLVHHSICGSQGGLNRSSQHTADGGCDDNEQTKI